MALVHPHPALKVSVVMNPKVDRWMGDGWFHHGAFRQLGTDYILDQEASRESEIKFWRGDFDDYDTFLGAGSAGELGRRHGLEQVGFWDKIVARPSCDAFWRDQAVDKLLAKQPLAVPVLLVHSLWGSGGHLRRERGLPGARPRTPATTGLGSHRRGDVTTDVLTQPVRIAGSPFADLVASTAGTDAD